VVNAFIEINTKVDSHDLIQSLIVICESYIERISSFAEKIADFLAEKHMLVFKKIQDTDDKEAKKSLSLVRSSCVYVLKVFLHMIVMQREP
jgi:hypothetical protein